MAAAVLTINGKETTDMIMGEGAFDILIPGVEIPETQGQGSTMFSWEGKNDQGQFVETGPYFLKVEQADAYGHVTTITKDINIMDGREYVELNVFNGAGELIRTQRQYGAGYSGFTLSIDVPDLISIKPGGSSNVTIKYTNNAADVLTWDGRTSAGMLVSNGIYEIQIIVKDDIRGTASTAKSVMVLRESDTVLGNLSIAPNPYTKSNQASGGMEIRWDFGAPAWQPNYAYAASGHIRIMILDVAGGLVRELAGDLSTGMIKWDTKTGFMWWWLKPKAVRDTWKEKHKNWRSSAASG
jgi:hypothetical protein